jgi:lipid-binding SYLF domain-containing protein
MRTTLAVVITGALAATTLAHAKDEVLRLQAAEDTLKAAVSAPDQGIPRELLGRAECIGVFPGVKKAAFVLGGEFGQGVFTCRQMDGTMSAPAFFSMAGPSIGWQFGGEEADLVLLIMNASGVKHLLADKFTLGGSAAVAAGPVGRSAQAATDAQLHAQILSWSRSRGVFLGASIEGNILKPDKDAIAAYYGKPTTAKQILTEGSVTPPDTAESFVKATSAYAKRSS